MSRTVYKNASGLPDDDQVTTARDQALLGACDPGPLPAILSLFLDPELRLRGMRIAQPQSPARARRRRGRHQDRLYARVRFQSRHLGQARRPPSSWRSCSADARPARAMPRMRELIEQNIAQASIKRTAPKIVEAASAAQPAPKARVASAEQAAPPVAAMSEPAPQKQAAPKPDTPKQAASTAAAIPPAPASRRRPARPIRSSRSR